jgi:hypothetical protein
MGTWPPQLYARHTWTGEGEEIRNTHGPEGEEIRNTHGPEGEEIRNTHGPEGEEIRNTHGQEGSGGEAVIYACGCSQRLYGSLLLYIAGDEPWRPTGGWRHPQDC